MIFLFNVLGWGTANYHPGKVAGDLTDAGDIMLMLLSHLSETNGVYKFDDFADYWYRQIKQEGYGSCNFMSVGREFSGPCPPHLKPGYLNGATRRTLEALDQRASKAKLTGDARKSVAADVNCLVAATHFMPLFLLQDSLDEDKLVSNAVSTVYLSHKNRDPVAAAEFLARLQYAIIHLDMPLLAAFVRAVEKTNDAFI